MRRILKRGDCGLLVECERTCLLLALKERPHDSPGSLPRRIAGQAVGSIALGEWLRGELSINAKPVLEVLIMWPLFGKSSKLCDCLLVAALSSVFTPSRAQSPATIKLFETDKHIGTPEEAVVGIEVTNKSANGVVETLHGNGVVIRSDGFILAPLDIFPGRMSDGKLSASRSVAVIAYPGTDHCIRLTARFPTNDNPAIGYVTIKVDDVHMRAVRTLFAGAVQAGDSLQVLYSSWDAATHKFLLPKRETVHPGKLPS